MHKSHQYLCFRSSQVFSRGNLGKIFSLRKINNYSYTSILFNRVFNEPNFEVGGFFVFHFSDLVG